MKILKTQRNHDKYLIGDQKKYIYRNAKSPKDGSVYVRCESHASGCKATHKLAVYEDYNMIDSKEEDHNHSPVEATRIDADQTWMDINRILREKVMNQIFKKGDIKNVFDTENSKLINKHGLDAGLSYINCKGNLYDMVNDLKNQQSNCNKDTIVIN